MNVLEIVGLHKSFGENHVLRGLDLTVKEHGIFGFIGKNGAGKTTAMKSILGLIRADSGSIKVMGEEVRYGESATNRHIGYLPDVPEFYSFMTAAEYLTFCAELTDIDRTKAKLRIAELTELVGLSGVKQRIKGYSRGMKQRLGIAAALLNEPRLLICDEPTSALDPVGRLEILDILSVIRDRTTVLFSTHILTDVERICTDIALLNEGRIAVSGPLSEIKAMHRHDEYMLELESEAHRTLIISEFPICRPAGKCSLAFGGDKAELAELLRFMAVKEIAPIRLERTEPTLENLFMEVLKK